MQIYIVRHGETESNRQGVFQGQTNSQLLESGLELARQTGAALAADESARSGRIVDLKEFE